MIGYFILGVCLLGALGLIGKLLLTADPEFLAKALRFSAFGLCAAVALFLLLTGRFALGLPLAFMAAAFLRRWALPRLGPRIGGGARPSTGRSSNVETDYLRMTLDHDSGAMRGDILRGTFAGRDLNDLTPEQLVELLAECRRHDGEAAQVLEAYLDRTQGSDWRRNGDGYGQHHGGHGNANQHAGRGGMSLAEACEVLGLEANPSPSEVREAHKRLMLKLHPDKGGSSYLAAKINQAKDLLLGV
ncbi:MAG: molecular chaperone DnaJ [Proteobacteria bacterium]|nr:molecular chaperone DnaJ [Pseudomonadota bacterium]